ncbi:MAG: hypothetical protein KDA61_04700 [Planctomycetales bacterium]|nr:hypothetical protein [Planctomycetales bacterium]
MKKFWTAALAGAATACFGLQTATCQIIRTTNYGLGADSEVREFRPTENNGAATELATRVINAFALGDGSDGNDRNSVMYVQFDLENITAADTTDAVLRLTFRNSNLNISRITDTDGVDPDLGQNGLVYYGIPNYQFDESAISYFNAKGISFDGDVGTSDFNSDAVLLGDQDFPLIGTQNRLAIGDAMDFSSPNLDSFLATEIAAGNPTAVFAIAHRNQGLATEPNNWKNFNYLFNPKEQVTLNGDPFYDADVNDPNNATGLPERDNSDGFYSPQLRLGEVPEPSAALLGATALLLAARRRKEL